MIANNPSEAFTKKGIKGVLRYFAQRLVGVEQLEDQINTLNYILKNYCDIHQFPKAAGELGALQRADTLLLAIVDTVLKVNNLEYW